MYVWKFQDAALWDTLQYSLFNILPIQQSLKASLDQALCVPFDVTRTKHTESLSRL